MADNIYTKTYEDTQSLTESELDTAFKSVQLDIAQSAQLTNAAVTGQVLTAAAPGAPATWANIPDPKGPFAIRNYGLATSVSSGSIFITLKTNAGTTPTTSDKVNLTFSNGGTVNGTYTAIDVNSSLSLRLIPDATLGTRGTVAVNIYVYAINVGGSVKLALSARSDLDDGMVKSTTIINSFADNALNFYATAALSVVARMLGSISASKNSSDFWQSVSAINITNNSKLDVSATSIWDRSHLPGVFAGLGGIALSGTSGGANTSSTSFVDVPNLSCTLTCSGGPILLQLVPDGNTSHNEANLRSFDNSRLVFRLVRDNSVILGEQTVGLDSTLQQIVPVGAAFALDVPPAGEHIYTLQFKTGISGNVSINYCKLMAYER